MGGRGARRGLRPDPARPVRPQQPLQPAGHERLRLDRPCRRGHRQGVLLRLPQQRDRVVVGDGHRAVLLARPARRRRGPCAPQLLRVRRAAAGATSSGRSWATARCRRSSTRSSTPEPSSPTTQKQTLIAGLRGRARRERRVQRTASRASRARRPRRRRRPAATPTAIINERCSRCHSRRPGASVPRRQRRRGAGAHRLHEAARRAGERRRGAGADRLLHALSRRRQGRTRDGRRNTGRGAADERGAVRGTRCPRWGRTARAGWPSRPSSSWRRRSAACAARGGRVLRLRSACSRRLPCWPPAWRCSPAARCAWDAC